MSVYFGVTETGTLPGAILDTTVFIINNIAVVIVIMKAAEVFPI